MRKFSFTIEGNKYEVEIKSFEENIANLEVNGTKFTVEIDKEVKQTKTPTIVRTDAVSIPSEQNIKLIKGGGKLCAPLPGSIIKIKVKAGDTVKKGETLLIMEAMKMENEIKAEKDVVIKSVNIKAGDTVLQGDLLIEMM